ncbi:MAG TPA: hypothetical protein VJR94_09260 [Candidatus Nitrosocosmicus sp.]|nr:hypothetical protein [Candidatus Nitrosocosmicus sp.]
MGGSASLQRGANVPTKNLMESANEIRDILTDNDRDNDQLVCNLIDSEDESILEIREILDC